MEKYIGIIFDRFCDDVRSFDVFNRAGILIDRASWNPEDGSLTVIYQNKSQNTICKELAIQFIQDCKYID